MLHRLPCSELINWLEYYSIEPWGAIWEEFLHARTEFRIVGAWVAKKDRHKHKFKDYQMTFGPKEKPSKKDIGRRGLAFAEMLRGKVKK